MVPMTPDEAIAGTLPIVPVVRDLRREAMSRLLPRRAVFLAASVAALMLGGCTSFEEYVHNGFKVGPNYCPPKAQTAQHWIDAADQRLRTQSDDLSRWWQVFHDPVLNELVTTAYRQNLTLKQAGERVLEARAQLGIARGEFFPQTQDATGSYQRIGVAASTESTKGGGGGGGAATTGIARFFDQWNYGFSLNWELDFWGRFRRAIAAAEATVNASVENYDDALVTLLADVANNYVNLRQAQEQIKWARINLAIQRKVWQMIKTKTEVGTLSDLDLAEIETVVWQTAAQIPAFEITQRQAENQLCILLGIPPVELHKIMGVWKRLDEAKNTESAQVEKLWLELEKLSEKDLARLVRPIYIPTVGEPPERVALGIPAQLLQRRPDVRRAEQNAAAQAEQIGIAMSDFYPHMFINGSLGWQAANLSGLFKSRPSTATSVPPSSGTSWNTAALSTTSACRRPLSASRCSSTSRPCSRPDRTWRTASSPTCERRRPTSRCSRPWSRSRTPSAPTAQTRRRPDRLDQPAVAVGLAEPGDGGQQRGPGLRDDRDRADPDLPGTGRRLANPPGGGGRRNSTNGAAAQQQGVERVPAPPPSPPDAHRPLPPAPQPSAEPPEPPATPRGGPPEPSAKSPPAKTTDMTDILPEPPKVPPGPPPGKIETPPPPPKVRGTTPSPDRDLPPDPPTRPAGTSITKTPWADA